MRIIKRIMASFGFSRAVWESNHSSFPSSSLGMRSVKLQLHAATRTRSWSFAHWVPKLELGNQQIRRFLPKGRLSLGVASLLLLPLSSPAGTLNISQVPLFLTSSFTPNVLFIIDNSNSMDEAENGAAVGSADPNSKSEIARGVLQNLVTTYQTSFNLGLMAYQQHIAGDDAVRLMNLHDSQYDASYNPADYDPAWTGARDAQTKKYRTENPSDLGNYLHYNVALPFYSASNFGNAFCYSPTANAFNNGENVMTGPWDTYRCFQSKTGTSNTVPIWNTPASETASGFNNFWFQAEFFPTDSDLALGLVDFGNFLSWQYIGDTWFSNTSPGRGYLHVPIKSVDAAHASLLNTKLDTSQFTTNAPVDSTMPLQNAGLTPLEGTLKTAKDYFAGTLSDTDEGYTASCYPLPNSCDHNYIILVTDGLPSTDENGNPIANPTQAIADTALAATELYNNDVKTYVVGFALPYGVDPATLNTIAAAGGTGAAYSASDAATLETALSAIFSDIVAQVASASSVALESASLTANDWVYQSRFNSDGWTGHLRALELNDDGSVGAEQWDAANLVPPALNRSIITHDGLQGQPFQWATLTPAQQALLNSDETLLNYLRGDNSNEGVSGFRERNGLVLGDIVHGAPAYVDLPHFHYPESFSGGSETSYATFRATIAASNSGDGRTPMIYVGANDGMLHGFDAETGEEKFAYVPNTLMSKLPLLSDPTYTHRYFVDGSPTVVDAFFNTEWHTVLVGGLGAGGQGIYALDVTDPDDFDSELTGAAKVLWEFNDSQDADLGYTFSEPNVIRMQNGRWAAAFGNGYNNTEADSYVSTTGNAVLYILDIENGGVIKKIDTGIGMADDPLASGRPNGLSGLSPIDLDGDYIADEIFAGDLFGNLWKFDISDSDPANWDVAYSTGSPAVPVPLYTARAADSRVQPITTRPQVGRHPSQGGVIVYFGTGKYFEVGDANNAGEATQSVYAIWDNGAAVTTVDRTASPATLLQQNITHEVDLFTVPGETSPVTDYRVTTENAIDWTTQQGWHMDLYNTEGGNTNNQGERIVANALLRDGRLLFSTLIPSSELCGVGGDGWLMELDAKNGSRLHFTPFDINADKKFNQDDKVTAGGNDAYVTGIRSTVGIPSAPSLSAIPLSATSNASDVVYISGTSGNIQSIGRNASNAHGRQSWRQLYR